MMRRVFTFFPTGSQTPYRISGRKLAAALKSGTYSPEEMAELAYGLQTDKAVLGHLTAKQTRWLTGATRFHLAAERRAHQPNGHSNGNGRRVLYRNTVTDDDVDAIVELVVTKYPEKVMTMLDKVTKPHVVKVR